MATIAIHKDGGSKAVFSLQFKDEMSRLGAWGNFVEEALEMHDADVSHETPRKQLFGAFIFSGSKMGSKYWFDIMFKLSNK